MKSTIAIVVLSLFSCSERNRHTEEHNDGLVQLDSVTEDSSKVKRASPAM